MQAVVILRLQEAVCNTPPQVDEYTYIDFTGFTDISTTIWKKPFDVVDFLCAFLIFLLDTILSIKYLTAENHYIPLYWPCFRAT